MKNKISILLLSAVVLFSCADEELGPVVTFDTAGKGAYVKLLSETDRSINLFDVEGSSYTYSVEFVDIDMGKTIAEYRLELTYVDKNPENGDASTGPIVFRTYSPSDFGTTDRGFVGLANIVVKATEMIAAVGTAAEDVMAGDQFKMEGYVVTDEGDQFGFSNSSSAVNGSAFAGHFNYTLNATCPTEIGGTYDYETVTTWCGGETITGEVTLTLTNTGYDIDDFSLGAYYSCYGTDPLPTLPGGNLRLVDVCNTISVTGASRWGEIYTYHSLTIDGASMTIEWTNDYGEGGTTKLTRQDGVALPALHL
ncbi:MAG: hypothetical protein KDC53_23285 [Saprospiraceae bacterium]|nr:hypothetical protein [Saprospiraceae bacterium]